MSNLFRRGSIHHLRQKHPIALDWWHGPLVRNALGKSGVRLLVRNSELGSSLGDLGVDTFFYNLDFILVD